MQTFITLGDKLIAFWCNGQAYFPSYQQYRQNTGNAGISYLIQCYNDNQQYCLNIQCYQK